ncbi:unnamed protein product [Linum trigynum]|uniref:Uncharacterized protein n=1 Tax=Linum trigynum TaxID=586398 RepID=A0AAV2DJ72_9ROSI
MAATTSSIFAATVLILFAVTSAAANWDEEAPTSELIHVSGKVLCQDCQKSYKDWISGERPIKGSTVSLTCMDDRKRVHHYDSDLTDERGEYEMVVSKYVNGKRLNEKQCWVRLVSSPDSDCNVLTDFAGGKSGVRLSQPTSAYRGTTKYDVGSFYYTHPRCERPEIGESDDKSGDDQEYYRYPETKY